MDELGSSRLSLKSPNEDRNAHHIVSNMEKMRPDVLTEVNKALELFGVSYS